LWADSSNHFLLEKENEMILNIGVAEIGIVVLGSLMGYAIMLNLIGFSKNGSGPDRDREPHTNRARYSPLLTGCLLGTVVNLACMALVWWLLYLLGLIG
jgi:hypothetical protein